MLGASQPAIKRLTNQIKHKLRTEKLHYRALKLEEETWKIVKREKQDYKPNHTKLQKEDGTVGYSHERPENFAKYYAEHTNGRPTYQKCHKETHFSETKHR